jgi:peptide chain release factor
MSYQSLWMQTSAGAGPAECCWAAHEVFLWAKKEAVEHGIGLEVVYLEHGSSRDTAQSILLELVGNRVANFAQSWEGTVSKDRPKPVSP